MNMEFKLPKLFELLDKDKKKAEDLPQKFIHVYGGNAFVLNNGICVVVKLKEYVKQECSIEEAEDIAELEAIIDWMEGRSFTGDFWKEFATKSDVATTVDGLEVISGHTRKTLDFNDIYPDWSTAYNVMLSNFNRQPVTIDRIGIDGSKIGSVMNVFKTEMATDTYLFDFCGKETIVKFTGASKDYIFGFIQLNYGRATELTAFLNVDDVRELLAKKINVN